MKKTLISLAILAALAGLSGCQRGIEPKAQAQSVKAERTVTFEASEPGKPVYYCAGLTKKGERCRKRVKAEGDYCWMHANQDKRKK